MEPNVNHIGKLPPVERQLFSLGHMAGMYQRAPSALLEILTAGGHGPALTLNDVAYFDGAAVLCVEHALQEDDGHE